MAKKMLMIAKVFNMRNRNYRNTFRAIQVRHQVYEQGVKKGRRVRLQQVFFEVAEDIFGRQDADELAVPDHRKMAVTADRHGMKRVSDGGVF